MKIAGLFRLPGLTCGACTGVLPKGSHGCCMKHKSWHKPDRFPISCKEADEKREGED